MTKWMAALEAFLAVIIVGCFAFAALVGRRPPPGPASAHAGSVVSTANGR